MNEFLFNNIFTKNAARKFVIHMYILFSQVEGFETKTKELDENLDKLDQIWTISKEWEDFESATFGEYLKNLQTDYLVSCSKQVQEKITAFCADKFDNRIEIHQTIQQRMSIFAGNLSIIEAFRSKAIKDRHWELISKSCGFQAIQNNELVIGKRITLVKEYYNISILLKRQISCR